MFYEAHFIYEADRIVETTTTTTTAVILRWYSWRTESRVEVTHVSQELAFVLGGEASYSTLAYTQ